MGLLGWLAAGNGLVVAVLITALALALAANRKNRDRLREAQHERDTLRERLVEQAATIELLLADDPSLDDLDRMSEAAAHAVPGPGAGLSQLEQAAADRILRPRPAGPTGEGQG